MGTGADLAYISHILVWVDEGASLTYVHEAASPTEAQGQTLHAGIVEIHVGAGANLRFVELQSWGEHVWNFSHERARVDRDGNLDWIFGAIGSHLTKNFSDLDLVGQGATGRMSGFYFTDGDQHLDHDTQQNHLAPHTTSDLLFKGALKDHSRSVWQGMIYVAPALRRRMATRPTATWSSARRRAPIQSPGWKFWPMMCAVHTAQRLENRPGPGFLSAQPRHPSSGSRAPDRGRFLRSDHAAHPIRGCAHALSRRRFTRRWDKILMHDAIPAGDAGLRLGSLKII